jgi:hypothetical protein
MLTIRTWAFIFAGALLATIVLASVGKVLESSRTVDQRAALQLPAMIVFFTLFLVMGFSGLALMIRLLVAGQRWMGNEAHPFVRFLGAHETGIIVGFFVLCLAGLAIAVPAALSDGFFGRDAQVWLARWFRGASKGVLVANVGMNLDEVRRRSTIKVPEGIHSPLTDDRTVIGEVVFDFEIGDTGTRFPESRYYFMVTRKHGDLRLESLNIGISPEALPRAEFDEFRRKVQERFRTDGWASGRFVYRTPEQQRLHGGVTSSGEGSFWLKGETVVSFEPKRMDDEQKGEDPKTAGKWILALQLWDRATSSTYERLEFTGGAAGPARP